MIWWKYKITITSFPSRLLWSSRRPYKHALIFSSRILYQLTNSYICIPLAFNSYNDFKLQIPLMQVLLSAYFLLFWSRSVGLKTSMIMFIPFELFLKARVYMALMKFISPGWRFNSASCFLFLASFITLSPCNCFGFAFYSSAKRQ